MKFRGPGVGVLLAAMTLTAAAQSVAARAQSSNLSDLHDALHLTTAQEDGWRAYKAAIAPDPYAAARRRAAAQLMPTLSTPRRIDLIDAEMSEDVAAMRRQGAAVKAFYASLSPAQQRAFDHQSQQGGQSSGATRQGGQTASGPQLRQPPPDTLAQPGRQP